MVLVRRFGLKVAPVDAKTSGDSLAVSEMKAIVPPIETKLELKRGLASGCGAPDGLPCVSGMRMSARPVFTAASTNSSEALADTNCTSSSIASVSETGSPIVIGTDHRRVFAVPCASPDAATIEA